MLVDPGFQSSPTDNLSNPAAPWVTVEGSGDGNPIYTWSSGGGMPAGQRVVIFKDGNGAAMPDYVSQVLNGVTADAIESFSVSIKAGWRGSLANDTATFRAVLWDLTAGAELGSAEFSYTSVSAISDTWTVSDGDPAMEGTQPFEMTIQFDRTVPAIAGHAVAIRIGRVDADSGQGANNWRSSAWLDEIIVTASIVPQVVSPAVAELLARRVPALADQIEFRALPGGAGDTFDIDHADGKVVIAGTNTNARAAGLHWYLKHHCGMHFSWSGDQIAVPSPLPLPDDAPRTSPWRWRSAHNHCVFSYSMAFWDWPRWEKEIDFLALNGVNQAFLLTGHEKVWQNTLRRLGFSDAQIATWLPSTSHISWWHFDNLQGEGGPLTQQEIDQEAVLARQAADRMRELGIEPVTLGFYGMVPDFFATRFPGAAIIPQGNWVSGYARPPMLNPSDPAFASTAAIYYEEMQAVLGPVKHFGGDPFHEGGSTGGNNLTTAYKKIQDAMLAATPEAVWVMFGWTGNPRQEGLANLQPQHVLVQQTSKHLGTAMPVSGSFRDYGGQIPWTWQIIDNFGGNHGLYGNFDTIATLPSRFLNGGVPGNFSGLGHSPEAIETNPMQVSLYYDMFWRNQDVDVAEWLDEEVPARYGAPSSAARKAWDLLARSSYRCPIEQEGICDYIFGTRPRAGAVRARTWSSNDRYWSELDIVEAWKLLLEAAPQLSGNANYRHDLVDVTRHALNFHSKRVYDAMMSAFGKRDQAAFDLQSTELLRLFDELDSVLGADPNFLLGVWLERAKAKGHDAASKARIERNARNLITLWSGKNDELDDYASRSWSGLVGVHYKSRWARYIADLRAGWGGSGTPAYSGGDLELAFLIDRAVFPTAPSGDVAALSAAVYSRLQAAMRKDATLRWSVPQEESGEVTLRFDVTERCADPAKSRRLSLSRQYGSAAVTLKRGALVTSGGVVLEEVSGAFPIGTGNWSRDFAPFSVPSGQRVWLELTLQGPGNHAVANGPVDFSEIFNATRQDYIGRFQYSVGDTSYFRELREDGTLRLYSNGVNYGGWAGYTWQFVNGEAHLFNAGGSLFERHRLSDAATLLFQVEPQYGPGIRIPATSYFRNWAIDGGMASIANDPDGDADQDGMSNLAEFFFGTDPLQPGSSMEILPAGDGLLRMRWKRRSDALLEAVAYRFEESPDLASWALRQDLPTSQGSSVAGYLDMLAELPTADSATFFRAVAEER